MIDKYGFTSNEATNFYSQIIFVARPATFLDDLTQLGFEITERSKLLDILQGFGPLWGDKSHLIYVLRTCRKQGITFSTDSVDLRELHAKLSKYRGVPRDLAQQFLAASSVQIRNHAA